MYGVLAHPLNEGFIYHIPWLLHLWCHWGTVVRLTFCIGWIDLEPVYGKCGMFYSSVLGKSLPGPQKKGCIPENYYCDTCMLLHLWCHTRTVLRLTLCTVGSVWTSVCPKWQVVKLCS